MVRDANLPIGVSCVDLNTLVDSRGTLMECYRKSWNIPNFKQFNAVHSRANVVRGVHVHPEHADYLLVLSGRMLLGLHDLRIDSSTHKQSVILELSGEKPRACFVPTGVAHGFYFPEPATYIYGLTEEWQPEGDFGCRWDDPELRLDWPIDANPLLSPRDEAAPPYSDMVARYNNTVARCRTK